jgi:phenylpropionate dioxygenase-like ring-hydroxylating dioxygenase large terminal subunit
MIRNQWYAVLDSSELPRGRALTALRLGEKLVFWRDTTGRPRCIEDRCCHRGASLGIGAVHGDYVECPFHGFRYDGNGRVTLIPANGKNAPVPERYRVNSYAVREEHGLIWLWWGDARQDLPEIPFFSDLREGWSYATRVDNWAVHYSRAIENQLDVVHLPFVHRTTIGRGNQSLVHGPVVSIDGQMLRFYVDNEVDDGKKVPKKPAEITGYESLPELRFIFPNVWQNIISDKVRVFVAFVPVDESHTVMYVRFYQRFMPLPLIARLINYVGIKYSMVIVRQDKQVVESQIPDKSQLRMDEKLIQGDRPIVEYRKRRQELINRES